MPPDSPHPLHRSYAESADLLPRVLELLEVVFPRIGETIELATPLGLRWTDSTPFLYEIEGRFVSHVGVIEMTFVLEGAEHPVGIIHGVATHPDHRRRGFYRAVMTEALAWCDRRYRTLVLNTGQPELYTSFGFRELPESRFVLTWNRPESGTATESWRRLDYAAASDRALLERLLLAREPVSKRFGVVRETQAFAFNEARNPPYHSAELDALVCMRFEGTTLQLHDVVAPRLPSLAEIVDRVDVAVDRIECYFTADRFDEPWKPEPHVLFGEDRLMVRGSLPPEGAPLMLAHPARC